MSDLLTNKEAEILSYFEVNDKKIARYGSEICKLSIGKVKIGTVYVLLGRMEKKLLIRAKEELVLRPGSVIPSKLYMLTDFGHEVLKARKVYDAALSEVFSKFSIQPE